MRLRACFALLLLLSACVTSAPSPKEPETQHPRLANLQRAAGLPWSDGGQCAVQEASQPWPILAERCYQVLDHDRVQFHDPTGRCAVASAGVAAMGLGLCVMAAPEIVVGAVVITGVVVVGFAIKEALEAYELRRGRPQVRPAPEAQLMPETKPAPQKEPQAKKWPKPEPKGPDVPPLWPPGASERERRPECEPIPVKHRGGDDAHNECADRIPPNRYPGNDVLVAGKHFDAMQVGVRVLWEMKTDQFDTYSLFLRNQVADDQVEELRKERDIATACGYGFVVGVSSAAHKAALLQRDPRLKIVVTECKR